MPGLPGAACSSLRRELRERAQASACSRPPDPTTSTFTQAIVCESSIRWQVGSSRPMFDVSETAYDNFMGRYSFRLALLFAEFAGVQAGQKVLDVGAGTGALSTELERRGAEIAAADPSPSFVAALERRLPGADVRAAAAEELPWPDE